jgi:hypothetical protein
MNLCTLGPPAGRYTALLSCLFLLGLATPALGQQAPQCGDRETVVQQLEQMHGEVLTYRAITDNGPVLEVYVSPHGTYTILIAPNDHVLCFANSGQAWSPTVQQPKGRGA